MAKYENIRALAKKQLQAVTESSDRWKAFLQTAAIAYNYSFPNQLLIHGQSPTATAVADIAYWNNNAGRWVKRGAHGIAVFDTRANSSRLRYLFDISDTIPRAEIPEALPWVITDQNWRPVWDKIVADNHADSIQGALLMLSTSCVAQRSAMFTTALEKAIDGSSLQWAKPDEQRQLFLQLITQSCLYMAALRCGVDTARLDLSALESVNQFDTNRITLCLGSACQQAARPLMQQIGSITREIDSVARAEKVRYYGDKQEETNNTKEVNNETRPLAGAEYTITAAEDIYTQDRQTDNYGNRTLWYGKGDVVAVVTTGDGSADIAAFAPARTKATYDFLSVIHDGTIGEVSVSLPLGSYHIEETKPPYGYVGTSDSYDVTFVWDAQLNDVVMATSIAKYDGAASSQSFEVVRSKDANADFTEQQTLKFYNDREKAKVGVYKVDRETGKYLAGAVFNLYTADDIYSVDGKLLFAAGELVATSPETGADGYTYFDCDIPIRGEYYGNSIRKDATTNSGDYIVKELRAPLGYYVNEEPMEVTFTYDGQAVMVLDNTCANKPTEMWVSKRDLTNDEELPDATLAIKDMDGNTVTTWVSTDEPHRVTGLHFGESYTLTEIRAADGYALANDITFRLIQKSDEDGNPLEECEVYYLTTKNILFWKWDDWKLLGDATVIMRDDITKVQISKKDLTTKEELPGAELTLTDEKGNEIDRWVSTDAPHYMERLPAGKYTLTEVTAPDGYAIAERVEFEVLPTGEVQTFEMFDDTIKVKISKVDITTNEELPGAELVIKDKDGTEIDRWISTNEPHYVEKMPAGDYTLTEITAPNGYKVAESIDFTVLPTGEIQTVVMKDAREDTPTPTPDNTPTPDHTPQPTPNTTPAPTPSPAAPTATPTPLLTIPKTGDNSPLGLLLAIAGISLVGLAILIYKSARSKELAPRTDEDNDTEE